MKRARLRAAAAGDLGELVRLAGEFAGQCEKLRVGIQRLARGLELVKVRLDLIADEPPDDPAPGPTPTP